MVVCGGAAGNLAIERGTLAHEHHDESQAAAFNATAEVSFEEAKQSYIRGFHESHPKVGRPPQLTLCPASRVLRAIHRAQHGTDSSVH
jgi:hypothetical protein